MIRRDHLPLLAAFALGIGWLLVMLLRSPGVLLDDELTHALISLNALRYPEALLDVWGRPGNTAAYMLPALLGGLTGRRLAAIAMTALTAVLAAAIAGRFGLRARWLVVLAVFFQPWISGIGFQSLTQMPFSLALAAGVLVWMTGRWGWAGLCFGLLPLIRHEGIALAGVWVVYALARRQWRSATFAIAPLALYNLAYLAQFGHLASGNLLDAVPTTDYGSGSWTHFLPLFRDGVGRPVLALFLLGLVPAARRRDAAGRVPGGRALLYLAPYALYFALHTVLYHFGLFASGGYGVFLLPLAPAVAVLAALGAEWADGHLKRLLAKRGSPAISRWAALAPAAVVIAAVVGVGLDVAPTPLDPIDAVQRQAASWVADWQAADSARAALPILAPHVAFWLAYQPVWPTATKPWSFEMDRLPAGGLLVWDSKYSAGRGYTPDALTAAGWHEVERFGSVEAGSAAVIYLREGA